MWPETRIIEPFPAEAPAASSITGSLLFSRRAIGIAWNALREPDLRQRNSAVTKGKIKQWQEDVVSRSRDIVMTHMIAACEAEVWRQPFLQVNAPMNFLGGDQVNTPTDHDAGRDPEVEEPVDGDYQQSVA